ncbi:hypothetical protein Acj133p015 [Acinetobacter phage 133]|uniref:Uncharacterized protein n=1 Tax=Acinetobacter phage 133 TaxID=2919552 RepID=D9I5Y1_9CAUD|nr:hypothetical protein Acj133p015 [Acinetobacter phage 133]ADJ19362.1 hypothetical protein Acj133p015 [Acinetobacter phage 133]
MRMSIRAAGKLLALVSNAAQKHQDYTYQNIANNIHHEINFTKEVGSFVKETLEVDIKFSDVDRHILTRLLHERKDVLRFPQIRE